MRGLGGQAAASAGTMARKTPRTAGLSLHRVTLRPCRRASRGTKMASVPRSRPERRCTSFCLLLGCLLLPLGRLKGSFLLLQG